jgi:glutamate--cysteine ligase
MYMPHGTSLRMGRLGYQSEAQASLAVSYNGLDGYAASLYEALTKPYAAYEAVGIMNPGGEYNQLATTLLQIENEFYGTIRPKRVIRPGERPLHALRERGVEYVEVRLLDLNPFVPVGITLQNMRLLDVFLLHCLLSGSPPDTPAEIAALGRNQHRTAAFGREPGLKLERDGKDVLLTEWGAELLAEFAPIASQLDTVLGSTDYTDALRAAQSVMAQPDLLPSARVLAVMEKDHGNSFTSFSRAQSQQTKAKLLALPFPASLQSKFEQLSADSVKEQKAIEASDSIPFETYRQQYISAERLGLTRAAIAPALAAV